MQNGNHKQNPPTDPSLTFPILCIPESPSKNKRLYHTSSRTSMHQPSRGTRTPGSYLRLAHGIPNRNLPSTPSTPFETLALPANMLPHNANVQQQISSARLLSARDRLRRDVGLDGHDGHPRHGRSAHVNGAVDDHERSTDLQARSGGDTRQARGRGVFLDILKRKLAA